MTKIITRDAFKTVEDIIAAGKTPWVVFNDEVAVIACPGRAVAREMKAANGFNGTVEKYDAEQFKHEFSKPVAPIGEKFEGDVHDYRCPHCGIDLDNGIGRHGDEVNGTHIYHKTYTYRCLACDGEFGPAIPAPAPAPTSTHEITRSSTATRPCKLVWEIAEKMPGARRKDIIAACVAAGVAFYTARTQYQLWLTVKNEERERELYMAKQKANGK